MSQVLLCSLMQAVLLSCYNPFSAVKPVLEGIFRARAHRVTVLFQKTTQIRVGRPWSHPRVPGMFWLEVSWVGCGPFANSAGMFFTGLSVCECETSAYKFSLPP